MINVFESSERRQLAKDAKGFLLGLKEGLETGVLTQGPLHRSLFAFTKVLRYGVTGSGLLEVSASRFPDRIGLVDDEGALTYTEMRTQARQTARILASHGIGPHSRVGILARNGRGFLTPFTAKGYLGFTVFLLNVGASKQQLHDIAVEHNLDVIFADSEFDDRLPTDVEGLTLIHSWVGEDYRTDIDFPTMKEFWGTPGPEADDLPRHVHQGHVILMSSGTSGTPKAVDHTEPSLPLGLLASPLASLKVKVGTSGLQMTASMFHVLGWAVSLMAMFAGIRIVTQRIFDPENVLRQIEENDCMGIISSAVFLKDQLAVDVANPGKYDTSSLKFIVNAGNAMSEDLVRGLQKQYGHILGSAYGSTESILIAWAGPLDLKEDPRTAGHPVQNGEVKLLGPDGKQVKPGEEGIVHGRTMMLMGGYLGSRDKAEMTGNLLNLGDRGIIDPVSGRLTVLGRANDMIIVGGENIWPSAVSDLICRIDGVADAYCVGVEDDKTFQRVKAYVVLDGTAEVSADDVRSYIESNLMLPAVPRDVVFQTESLPRNPIGKVVKRDLRD